MAFSKWVSVNITESGAPKLGLTPTITIYDLDATVPLVGSYAMTAIASGIYVYDLSSVPNYHGAGTYVALIDAGALSGAERYHYWSNDILQVCSAFGV